MKTSQEIKDSVYESLSRLLEKEMEERNFWDSAETIEFHNGLILQNDEGQKNLIKSLLSKNTPPEITPSLLDLLVYGSNYDCWSFVLYVAVNWPFAEYILNDGIFPKCVSIETFYHSFPEVRHKNSHKNGDCFEFTEEGVLYRKHSIKDCKWDGECVDFFTNSEDVSEIRNYKNDKLDGKFVNFNGSNGLKSEECFYVNGVLHGENICYFDDGTIKEICPFVNGYIKGDWIEYNRDGTVKRKRNINFN